MQDHYHHSSVDHHPAGVNGGVGNGSRASRPGGHSHALADMPLPDFALDAAADHSPRQAFADGTFYGNGGGRADSSSNWLNSTASDEPAPDSPLNGIARSRSPSGGNEAQLRLSGGSDLDDSLPEDVSASGVRHSIGSSPPEVRHHLSSHASGGLPDFLSDSAIVGAAALVSTPGHNDNGLEDDHLRMNHVADNEASLAASVRRVNTVCCS